jgi:hypothetical protein
MKKSCIKQVIGTWLIDGLLFGEDGILVITPDLRVVQFPPETRRVSTCQSVVSTSPRQGQMPRLVGAEAKSSRREAGSIH